MPACYEWGPDLMKVWKNILFSAFEDIVFDAKSDVFLILPVLF